MFSAKCYQKAKNRYEKIKITSASKTINLVVKAMRAARSAGSTPPSPKFPAIYPMTSDIDGIQSPATIAPIVPTSIIILSLRELYLKY